MSISMVDSMGSPAAGAERSLQMAMAAARAAAENRGRDIVVLDMRELTPIFDYFVVATGTSRRQLHAMSEEIDHTLEDSLHDSRLGIEGYRESRWIVLDYGNIVVHLFDAETRDYYALEQLWADAVRVELPEWHRTDDGSVSFHSRQTGDFNGGQAAPHLHAVDADSDADESRGEADEADEPLES